MAKKKKEENPIILSESVGMEYLKELDNDDKYSLRADPTGFYGMDAQHKQFVELYSRYNNLMVVCELMNIEMYLAKDYLLRYSTQQELRRINLAIYHRSVATKIISYEDLGSYLSAWLIGDNVPEKEQLKKGEKLQLVKLMMDWHKGMKDFQQQPNLIIEKPIEEELEQLKAADIKELLQKKKLIESIKDAEKEVKTKKKSEPTNLNKSSLIKQIKETGDFTKEELKYINELSVEELKELLK